MKKQGRTPLDNSNSTAPRERTGQHDQSYRSGSTPAGSKGIAGKPSKKAPPPRGRAPKPPKTVAPIPQQEWVVPTGDWGRDAVISRLARQVRKFPRLELTGPEIGPSVDTRDAALAFAMYDAVVRRWITLERLIAKKARKPLASIDGPVRAALLAGAAQIVLLDRVPSHAAVNHAVQWTKLNVNTGAAGFVNAVLHRLSEAVGEPRMAGPLEPGWQDSRRIVPLNARTGLTLTEDLLPDESDKRLSVALGMPVSLLASLRAAHGDAAAIAVGLAGLENGPTVLNTAHARIALSDSNLETHQQPGHAVFTGQHSELARLLKSRPDVWAQDPASSLSLRHAAGVLSTAGFSPTRVLDLCAGQGTKTRQLAAMFPESKIVATDTDERRLSVLGGLFHGSPQVTVVRPTELEASPERFDLILLDVPCSNTGVLSRRPEARHRADENSLKDLIRLQREIITRAVGLLDPAVNGCVVYATCSLDPRENSEQTAWAMRTYGLTSVSPPLLSLPSSGPATSHHDGAFVHVLTRVPHA